MTNTLNILTYPNSKLRQKAKEITAKEFTSEQLKRFTKQLIQIMLKIEGVGLAAPQVGQSIRIIVVNAKDGPICLINPKIIKKSWRREWGEEGCLSVPDVYGKVLRPTKINCSYFDQKGKKNKLRAQGLLARVIQHEIDHLDGILFIDKAREIKKVKSDK